MIETIERLIRNLKSEVAQTQRATDELSRISPENITAIEFAKLRIVMVETLKESSNTSRELVSMLENMLRRERKLKDR